MAKTAFKSKTISSSREERRAARQAKRRGASNVFDLQATQDVRPDRNESLNTRPIQYRSQAQAEYHELIKTEQLTFGVGPAGTGKSYVATHHAAILLMEKKIKKIIVTRPAVECSDTSIGMLPGEESDKLAPYFAPIRRMLEERLGHGYVDLLIKRGTIEFAHIGFLRGCTFDDAFVILDEAQNTTPREMKTFLTRIGRNCTVVVDGDLDQCDLKGESGLRDALIKLQGMKGSGMYEFDEDDIVRSGITKEIAKRYAGKSKRMTLDLDLTQGD